MKPWIICAFLAPGCVLGQQPSAKVGFEVASIRPSTPAPDGNVRVWMSTDAGMLRYSNVSLKDCIRVAYDVKEFEIQGPDWIGSTRFDIIAKLPTGSSESQIPGMLQAMLAERLKLAVHRDTKATAIYELVAVKGAPALKPVDVPANTGTSVAMDESSGIHLTAPSATLATLAELISRFVQHPVIDMTGIQGHYDFDLVFSGQTMRQGRSMEEDDISQSGVSIYDSLRRYGLKLELRKSPLEVLVVDHVEKMPTEN
ncbi:MAG TPA: TIGR03435 family protein [Bryobacteraceae bacterium]|jgi:uncharacterized protein (TIGR03435 family)